jgi:hypothetical protein
VLVVRRESKSRRRSRVFCRCVRRNVLKRSRIFKGNSRHCRAGRQLDDAAVEHPFAVVILLFSMTAGLA